MNRNIDIHKAAGVLLEKRKFLIVRAIGKDFFIAPGGKVESDETVCAALCRELNEELSIQVAEQDLRFLDTFFAPAAGREDRLLQMDVFIVQKWQGVLKAASELEEIKWINSQLPPELTLASIFKHDVIPKLKQLDLID